MCQVKIKASHSQVGLLLGQLKVSTNLYKDNESSRMFWGTHQKIIQRQLFQLKRKVVVSNFFTNLKY